MYNCEYNKETNIKKIKIKSMINKEDSYSLNGGNVTFRGQKLEKK